LRLKGKKNKKCKEGKMVRKGTEKILKAFKDAKTAEEMVKSWDAQRPGFEAPPAKALRVWIERKPEIIEDFAHVQLIRMLDKGILDPKTRALIKVALCIWDDHWFGILPEACSAKAAGATEEELMEVAYLVCAARCKMKMTRTSGPMTDIFENPLFKSTKFGSIPEKT
jgi:alkylhydroperoxidase/carboxymuconolactone decarboxylase family protein YurZ